MWLRWSVQVISLFVIGLTSYSSHGMGDTLYYPAPESSKDYRHVYPLKVLDLAFSKMDYHVNLLPNQRILPQSRALQYLDKKRDMDVVWTMTSQSREKRFLPIRIPIFKGLIGWRIPLVKEQSREEHVDIDTHAKLTQKIFLQGSDWPDRLILEANGMQVEHRYDYLSLFKHLSNNGEVLFMRSLVEIWREYEMHKKQDIVVEPSLMVKYPAAFYFFVHKDNRELADIIRQGLIKSIDDGSFDKVFDHHFKKIISKSRIKERNVIELKNPLLPRETPLGDGRLWY